MIDDQADEPAGRRLTFAFAASIEPIDAAASFTLYAAFAAGAIA